LGSTMSLPFIRPIVISGLLKSYRDCCPPFSLIVTVNMSGRTSLSGSGPGRVAPARNERTRQNEWGNARWKRSPGTHAAARAGSPGGVPPFERLDLTAKHHQCESAGQENRMREGSVAGDLRVKS